MNRSDAPSKDGYNQAGAPLLERYAHEIDHTPSTVLSKRRPIARSSGHRAGKADAEQSSADPVRSATAGRHWLLQLPRRSREPHQLFVVPCAAQPHLASSVAAARRPAEDRMDEVRSHLPPLSTPTTDSSFPSVSTLQRHSSKVGAVCVKYARTVLCGGRFVRVVPTATSFSKAKGEIAPFILLIPEGGTRNRRSGLLSI